MRNGIVKWYNAKLGYGFLYDGEGKEVFVHQAQIQMKGFRRLTDGDHIQFEVGRTDKSDRVQAINVVPILTLDMVKKRLRKDGFYVEHMKDVYGNKAWCVVDASGFLQSGESGLCLEDLAAYAGFDVEGLK